MFDPSLKKKIELIYIWMIKQTDDSSDRTRQPSPINIKDLTGGHPCDVCSKHLSAIFPLKLEQTMTSINVIAARRGKALVLKT